MTKISEVDFWPKSVVKLPKPHTILSPEQFTVYLLQDVAALSSTSAIRVSWLFMLSYSVS